MTETRSGADRVVELARVAHRKRCGGLLAVVLAGVALPASQTAYGQLHGITIAKGCEGPVCVDELTTCTLRFGYNDDFGDTLKIHAVWDVQDIDGDNVRLPAEGAEVIGDTFSNGGMIGDDDGICEPLEDEVCLGNLPIVAVAGNTTCTVGGSLPCVIGPGESELNGLPGDIQPGLVRFRQDTYVVQANDAVPVVDQATVLWEDLCDDKFTTGCGAGILNVAQVSASTIVPDCDDDNPCTDDVCENGVCEHIPDCTEQDLSACEDGNPCTLDLCDTEVGCCRNIPDCEVDGDCPDDGNPCTTETCSDDGCCESTPDCEVDGDCPDDGNPCTTETCSDVGCCESTPDCVLDGDCPDDGNPCTTETCADDGCCERTPDCTPQNLIACDDGNQCTTETCGADSCCESTPDCEVAADCEDRPCFDEECTASGCCGGMDKICEIIPPCTIQVCNPNTDECEPVGVIDCNDEDPCTNDRCDADLGCVNDLIACCGTECSPITKAKFDLWNGNENRFSGTDRCISSWDQTLLSQYTEGGVANHFWRSILQTDRGKARIDGLYSPTVCGEESIDAPLLGVASKLLTFNGSVKRSGRTLVGIGEEPGVISYDLGSVPQPALGAAVSGDVGTGLTEGTLVVLSEPESTAGSTEPPVLSIPRAAIPEKGSLLAFTKVEMKWDSTGQLIQDSFIELTNDYPLDVNVKLYFVHGDLCIWSDNTLRLTANQAVYWSVASGQPAGVSPFTVLGEGCPDDDPRNPGGRRLRGYVLAWAVDSTVGTEIHWNHLSGNVLIVNYADASAWEYNAWAFRAVWDAKLGDPLLLPYGQLNLDGVEYQAPPAQLYFDFYGSGSMFDGGVGGPVSIDTDLTLWIPVKNLEQ